MSQNMAALDPLTEGLQTPTHTEESVPDHTAFVRLAESGERMINLMIDGIHCGGCIAKIERTLRAEPDVTHARANLSTKRLSLRWTGVPERANTLIATIEALGFPAVPYDPQDVALSAERHNRALLRCMAVAGFAAGNIMLLSVSVWAGHVEGMGPATRALFHWFSALIALPTVIYAGRPFFASAYTALRARRMNMDVPISLALILTVSVSLLETVRDGPHVYFDSAVTLLFFLLIGRFLDSRARGRARAAAHRLLALGGQAATVLRRDGTQQTLPVDQIDEGMTVITAPGERIAVDGTVSLGRSDIDTALITGESLPQAVAPGTPVHAGTMNLTAPLRITVTAVGDNTLLAEIVRLMELAEQRRARFVVFAERTARLYAPVVHLLALATFLGWWAYAGSAWQDALLTAVAVLIITCPCALGLAVPAVQVVASGRLMRSGTLLKSDTALERLSQVDTIVFDKTGTLTVGVPELLSAPDNDPDALRVAAGLAANSRHPLARALVKALPPVPALDGVEEEPGCGLRWTDATTGQDVRLGNAAWCGVSSEISDDFNAKCSADGPELYLAGPGRMTARFAFQDRLRDDAATVVASLKRAGYDVHLLSGDRRPVVEAVAAVLDLSQWHAACRPDDKTAMLERLRDAGKHVLMVGDGLNDAPALIAAHVSLSPASAVDIAQTSADAVFQGASLRPVQDLLDLARRAQGLMAQNIALSVGYNLCTVPLAMAGYVTPLIAAVAMSSSSLLVTLNALRLGRSSISGNDAR